ncbi:MAG TPA: hypothetical protein VFI02_00730 [Armatimonadota bacterium]|nr:hypothetical protein [Armatimonadota bacterium]
MGHRRLLHIRRAKYESRQVSYSTGPCRPLITGNTFIDNDGKDHGGAIALEGEATNPLIVNNLFLNNYLGGETYGGGAISQKQGSCRIINNTFAGNTAANGCGGAVTLAAPSKLYNNIFYNNSAYYGGLSVYSSATDQDIQFCDAFADGAVNNAVTHFKGVDPQHLQDCLYADPLFADTVDYRLRLTPTPSPCIDKGANPASTPYDDVPNVDIEGNPRPVDISGVGNEGGIAYSDMGGV